MKAWTFDNNNQLVSARNGVSVTGVLPVNCKLPWARRRDGGDGDGTCEQIAFVVHKLWDSLLLRVGAYASGKGGRIIFFLFFSPTI